MVKVKQSFKCWAYAVTINIRWLLGRKNFTTVQSWSQINVYRVKETL